MNDSRLALVQPSKAIELIGVACGEGAQDRHCRSGPDALRDAGVVDRLQAHGLRAAWGETIRARAADREPLPAVRRVCETLASRTQAIVADGRLPVVVGGDHSCALGTWKGVASALGARGPLGLIWIDAHMDAHTPETTPSGALHGMPLACLLGFGDERLTSLAGGARLQPQHVCLIGVRSFEAGEAALLERLGVRVFFMDEVKRRGVAAVMADALAIATAGTVGFGVTLDLDALDPMDAPGVGSLVAGGLRAAELGAALGQLRAHPALAAIEIAEYNPERDRDGVTGRLAVESLQAMLAAEAATPGMRQSALPPLTLVTPSKQTTAAKLVDRAARARAA